MGINYNTAGFTLAEYLCQANLWYHLAAEDILQHCPRTNCRQLIHITYQDNMAALRHSLQKMAHQRNIHHGNLIQDNHICFQWFILTTAKERIHII